MKCLGAWGILLSLMAAGTAPAATWYVRNDGGTASQCNGTVDAPYPGTGSNQPCAFINPYYLWTNDPPQNKPYEIPKWKIAGGDTVILKNGDYRMGYKTPDINGYWNYLGCRGNNHGCSNPPIPPGTDAAPTRIVGENWQSGCQSKPILRGTGGVSAVLSLKGTNHVDVECIDFTDAAQCRSGTTTGEPYACVNYQSDDAYTALQTDQDTSYVTLRNLFIHGFASAGILGSLGGNIVADHLHLRANGNFGWDFDPGGGAPSKGPLSITNTIIEWSACVERYPLADPVIMGCYDQAGANANGDGLGFVDLVGDITLDHDIIRYNQQDGLDALYVKSGKTLSVTNSLFYGNSGQPIKVGGAANTIIRNNLVVGNCARQSQPVAGVTADNFNVLEKGFCRASDFVAMAFKNGTSVHFENNTLVTYHPTAFDMQCSAITDVFNGSGRSSTDGSLEPSMVPDGSRTAYGTEYPITNMQMWGGVYVYPKVGSRVPKTVGQVGVDQTCNGSTCQFWYVPGTAELVQDPSQPPLQPTDELRVSYNNPSLCTTSTMTFANNLVRGYHPLRSTEMAGSFWFNNFPDGSMIQNPATRQNNVYCGIKGFTAGPSEIALPVCPASYFSTEPPALTSEDQLDKLVLYPSKSSPVVDAGAAISDLSTDFDGTARPYGPAPDIGAFELAPVTGTPTGLQAHIASGQVVLTWDRVAGAAYYDVQRRSRKADYAMLDKVLSTLDNMIHVTYVPPPADVTSCYRIRAGNDLGTGEWSAEVCTSAPIRRSPMMR